MREKFICFLRTKIETLIELIFVNIYNTLHMDSMRPVKKHRKKTNCYYFSINFKRSNDFAD